MTPSTSELWLDVLDEYFESVEGLTWSVLKRRQNGLTVSLAFGAAGIAYAHVYAGFHLQDENLLRRADAWIREASRHEEEPDAFLGRDAEPGMEMPAGAFLFGLLGLRWVDAWIAEIRRERRRSEALSRFLETTRLAETGPFLDLYRGVAGALSAAAALLKVRRDPRLVDLSRDLLERLEGEARSEDGILTWPGLHGPGLAHGDVGAHLALLLGAEALGRTPAPNLGRSLEALIRRALRDPASLVREPRRGWLCNGFAGLAYAAARAHQSLGGDDLLDAARRSTELVLAHPPLRPDLCCGRLGVAYACLAVARQDPTGPWRRHALEHALSALLCESETWPVVGLYGGEAALPCIALDLLSETDQASLPCLEPGTMTAKALRATA